MTSRGDIAGLAALSVIDRYAEVEYRSMRRHAAEQMLRGDDLEQLGTRADRGLNLNIVSMAASEVRQWCPNGT